MHAALKRPIILRHICEGFEISGGVSLKEIKTAQAVCEDRRNFTLITKKGSYIVKVRSKESFNPLANELFIQDSAKEQLPIAQYVPTKEGAYSLELGDFIVKLQPKIEGEHPRRTFQICEKVGALLAGFHCTVPTLPRQNDNCLLDRTVIERRIADVDAPKDIKSLLESWEKIDHNLLPSGAIHTDVHVKNLLARDGEVTLLDLEEATNGPLILDVARSIADICSSVNGIDAKKLKVYLMGYESKRELSSAEREALIPGISYSAAAVALWFLNYGSEKEANYFINVGKTAATIML